MTHTAALTDVARDATGSADRTVQIQLDVGVRGGSLGVLPQHTAQALRQGWVLHLRSLTSSGSPRNVRVSCFHHWCSL